MAEPWRLAEALKVLRAEVNTAWPDRDKRSDGSVGDTSHAARTTKSDHNPNVVGVVRAVDLDKDLTGPTTDRVPIRDSDAIVDLAGYLRDLGRAGDPRLVGGGYLILRGRIASEVDGWSWRPYTGVNAHAHHLHVSVTRNASHYDSRAPWGVGQEEDDDLNEAQAKQLAEVHRELTTRLPNRTGDPKASGADTLLGYAANGDGYGFRLERFVRSEEFLEAVAKRVADHLLGRKVDAPTWRDGTTPTEATPVGALLARASEASITRHRNEVGAK